MYLPWFEPGTPKISSCWNISFVTFRVPQYYAACLPGKLYSVLFKHCYGFVVEAIVSRTGTYRSTSYLCVWRRTATSRTTLRGVIGILGPNRLLSLCVFMHRFFVILYVRLSETNDTICRQTSSRCLHDLYIETHVLEHTQERWEFGCIFRFQILW
jgi:hypothetical protein